MRKLQGKILPVWGLAATLLLSGLNAVPVRGAEGTQGAAGNIPATAFSDQVPDGEIQADGRLDEAVWGELENQVDKRIVATTLNNTCFFSTVWDQENLYVGVKVSDAVVVESPLSENIYENDSIEIFIDPDNDGEYDDHTAHFMIQAANGKWDIMGGAGIWDMIKDTAYPGASAAVARSEDGYTAELKIPFEDMGIESPETGMAVGLSVCCNDNDSTSQIERTELYWLEDFEAGNAVTWGAAYLSAAEGQMVSWERTPEVDGRLTEEWETVPFAQGGDFTASAASMCDASNLYLAFRIEAHDPGRLEEVRTGELCVFLSGDNGQAEGRSPDNTDLDLVYNMAEGWTSPGSYLRSCDSDPGQEGNQYSYFDLNQVQIAEGAEGNVLTVELAVPWEIVKADRDYLTTLGMEAMFMFGGTCLKWSGAQDAWNASAGYGRVVLNSKNIAVPENRAPGAPNQINSFSIAQGGTVSGRLNVTDADGDKLEYALVQPSAGAEEGTFVLNEETGEWSYSTPDDAFMKPEGVNYFVEVSDGNGGVFRSRIEIRVEHAPTYRIWHVDGDDGDDSNAGTSADAAFQTIEKAHSVTNPGDVVLIYDSSAPYGWNEEARNGIVLSRSGLPGAYITYKAAQGNEPVIKTNGEWNTLMVTGSYIRLEGLNIGGIADEVTYEEAYAVFRGKTVPEDDPEYIESWDREVSISNTNGINISPAARISDEGVTMDNLIVPHHVEVSNCSVNKVSASGLSAIEADYIVFENNTITNCCWWDMYGSSGISFLDSMDIDGNGTDYKNVVRGNIVAGTRHFIPWCSLNPPRLSDGNGIIVDSNNHNTVSATQKSAGYEWGVLPYGGRTLVVNNLCYENGGSGMHVFDSNHVDMINNTVYDNAATTGLGYSEFYASQADDVRMYNNIVYSRSGSPLNVTSSSNQNVEYDNNLFFNYDEENNNIGTEIKGSVAGESNLCQVDPKFKEAPVIDNSVDTSEYPQEWTDTMKENAQKASYSPSRNYDITQYQADFTLEADSPARNAGNEEWSKIVGNTDNRLGIFGTIGKKGN